jgi:hypothetical protein
MLMSRTVESGIPRYHRPISVASPSALDAISASTTLTAAAVACGIAARTVM